MPTREPQRDPKIDALIHPRKRWYKRVWVWLLVVLVLLGVGFRLVLDPVAAHFARQGLAQIKGYKGDFDELHIRILGLSTTITNFELTADAAGSGEEPVMRAETIEGHLLWSDLLKLQLAGQAEITKAKVAVYFDPKGPPESEAKKEEDKKKADEKKKEKEEAKKEGRELPGPPLPDFDAVLHSLIPFRVDRIELKDCEVVGVDIADKTERGRHPRVWLHEIEATLENVTSRAHLAQGESATVAVKAALAHSGRITIFVTADPLQKKPAFAGQIELKGLKLSDFDAWAETQAHLDVTGTLDFFASFKSEQGKVTGGLKPVLEEVKVHPSKDANLGQKAIAKGADIVAGILSDRVPGRQAIAAVIPITGQLTDPDIQLWPAVLSVVRNAFVQGVEAGFKDTPPPASDKPEAPLKQATDSLSKDNGVKTQPKGGAT